MNNAQICARWFGYVTGSEDFRPSPRSSNIIAERDTLYSYGRHFPMVTALRDGSGAVRLFLLNGDRYSPTTDRHQSHVRAEAGKTDVPAVIVPFSALTAAGIVPDTIDPAEVLPDRYTATRYTCNGPHEGSHYVPDEEDGRNMFGTGDLVSYAFSCEGGREHVRFTHHLGASVFRADVVTRDHHGNRSTRHAVPFVSAFDEQEARPLYFLAELPGSSRARTYEQALTDLRPAIVQAADAEGVAVTRQGDMFAVPMGEGFDTRQLRKMGATIYARKDGARSLFGTAHTATMVAELPDGTTYARGMLYHDPALIGDMWRERDHARRKIADGKTWARIVPNTVPRPGAADDAATAATVGNTVQSAAGVRAWTMNGRVD